MTKKDLKEYIKEIILQEVSKEDVESAKELNKELEKTKELSDELGLTKENKNSKFNVDRFQGYSNNELIGFLQELIKQREKEFQKSNDDEILRLDRVIHQSKTELKKRSQKLKALSRTDENQKPKFNINNHVKAIQIQLDQLGIKYEMDPTNKVNPFKVIYVPTNKSDKWYDQFEGFLFRYKLQSIAKPTDYKTLDESKKKNSEEKLDFTIKELVRLRKELKSNQNQLSKIMTDESKKEEADDLSVKINNIKKQIKELETLRFQLEK